MCFWATIENRFVSFKRQKHFGWWSCFFHYTLWVLMRSRIQQIYFTDVTVSKSYISRAPYDLSKLLEDTYMKNVWQCRTTTDFWLMLPYFLGDFFNRCPYSYFLGQVEKMCDSCFGTLRAKRNLMPSPRPTTEELKLVSLPFPPQIMPPLKPSKSGNERWKMSVDMCQWYWCKTRLTCYMNPKLTGKNFPVLVKNRVVPSWLYFLSKTADI